VAPNYTAGLKTLFPDGKIRNDLQLRSKEAKKLSGIRSEVTRVFSDYLSEELRKGGFGGALSKQQKATFKRRTGAKGDISPDSILDLEGFEQLLKEAGIRIPPVLQSKVLKGEALTGTSETKVTGIGDTDDIQVTSAQIGGTDKANIERFKQARGSLLRLDGDKAIDFFLSPSLKKYRDVILASTQAKFENATIVNFKETAANPFTVLFVSNPLQGKPLNKATLKKYFTLSVRQRRANDITQGVRIEIRTNAAFTAELKKQGTDITKAVILAHQKINKDKTFGQGFLNYVKKRVQGQTGQAPISTKDPANWLAFAVAFAREFDKNPLSIKTNVQSPTSGITQAGGLSLKDLGKKREKKALQKEITAAQLTALVYKRLGTIMPRGPVGGPPLSGTILTERTGRFRRSVQVIPLLRQNLIRFTYDPIYQTHISTPRNPDTFVGKTIREIVQGKVAQAFRLERF
jgi:hypothetical protein